MVVNENKASSSKSSKEMISNEQQQCVGGNNNKPNGLKSRLLLLQVTILGLAWLAGFCCRLFAVIRFESIIHEFDPWYVDCHLGLII